MGKSTLVQSIQTQAREKGIYASSKFDQNLSPKPFSALVSCLRTIMHQILADTPEQIEELRHELKRRMCTGAMVLANFVAGMHRWMVFDGFVSECWGFCYVLMESKS